VTSRQDAIAALERIAYILEREREPSYRVRAFRNAAAVVRALPDAELEERSRRGTLSGLTGIGPVTARVIEEAGGGDTRMPATPRIGGPAHCGRRAGAAPGTAR
jgi:DNA polymerase/3'-5' exonuclease PolX